MRHLLAESGLDGTVEVDSAGTGAYHAGESPDRRATSAARARGIVLSGRARQFRRADWDRFDYVLAMDSENLTDLRASVPDRALLDKLRLFRSFDPNAPDQADVPDPYYGGDKGFERVLDMCEAACRGLIAHLRRHHEL
jgi:protein-tyrosine phosphatase